MKSLPNFGTGMMFWMLGAWPIMGFCGLDVLLVYIAFRASYRSGRAYEAIELSRAYERIASSDLRQSLMELFHRLGDKLTAPAPKVRKAAR